MNKIIEEVGPYGLFQKLCLLSIGSITLLVSMMFYVTIFNTSEPALICKNNNQQIINGSINTCLAWSNYSISKSESSNYSCEFSAEDYGTTIVNDWNLVCEKSYLVGLTQTFYLMGGVCGFMSGYISDKYGRKKATVILLIMFQIVISIFNVLSSDWLIVLSISNKLIIYNIFQFLNGALSICIFNSSYVLLVELTTCNYHTLFSNINIYFYVIGEVVVMGCYYWSRNWMITNYFISIYSLIVIIIFSLFVPESPL